MADNQDPLSYPMHQLSAPGQPYIPASGPLPYSPQPPEHQLLTAHSSAPDPAIDLIRQKLNNLYSDEPSAAQEMLQAHEHTHPGSKHQQYMQQLSSSGMSMAEIQNAWHAYYLSLPEHERYEVWDEFYAQAETAPAAQQAEPLAWGSAAEPAADFPLGAAANPLNPLPVQPAPAPASALEPQRSAEAVPATLRDRAFGRKVRHLLDGAGSASWRLSRVTASAKNTAAQQAPAGKFRGKLGSIGFGLACGALAVFIFLFSFFNEVMIAPFIQPSRKQADTPVIVNTASASVSADPKILIPKINLEIPVDYSQSTTDENSLELALDKGVVHYPTTAKPGEYGNAAFFGHSSNNIFNPGQYKFAFVLLHELVEGDTFYLTRDGKAYAYRVFAKRVVDPSEVGVLNAVEGHNATATLITCDPPGTSLKRLVVVGDQISPDPGGNATPQGTPVQTAVNTALPGNGPTLWARIWGSVF